jgi:hypothetical protein
MTQRSPLCFEVYLKEDAHSLMSLNSSTLDYERLLNSLIRLCENLTFSLRYLYNPLDKQKLRSFILINPSSQVDDHEIFEKIEGLLKVFLSRFYSFTYQPEVFQQLSWVNSISQIIKYGEFIEKPEFIGYLPHPFSTELNGEHSSLLELLQETRCQKLVLEFSLGAYFSPDEQALWNNAVKNLVSCLSNYTSKTSSIRYAHQLYKSYQDDYSKDQLFRYGIKALGCNSIDTSVILEALGAKACKIDRYRKSYSILTFKHDDSNFSGSLEATQTINIFQGITWDGWRTSLGKKIENQAVETMIKPNGLLAHWDDRSLELPGPYMTFEESLELSEGKNLSLPHTNKFNSDLKSSNLVLGGSFAISKIYEDRISKVKHLKPLHHTTTFQEVIGFIKIFQLSIIHKSSVDPLEEVISSGLDEESNYVLPDMLYVKDVIQKYQNEITEDKYIVGIDRSGVLCLSDWERSPHRIVAGTTGAGKTNFLSFLIYQLLYVNPNSKIFLADFQAGLHFQFIENQYKNIEMVTQLEDFSKLLKNLVDKHECRRDVMKSHNSRSRIQLQQKSGIKLDRNFLIIDEAFFIQNADGNIKKDIERHLTTLASQARVTGIHIVYCSQTPNLFNKQMKACIEEKVILRVASDSESFGLLGNHSAVGLENGMAIYREISYNSKSPKIVKVPYVPDEVWDSPIR